MMNKSKRLRTEEEEQALELQKKEKRRLAYEKKKATTKAKKEQEEKEEQEKFEEEERIKEEFIRPPCEDRGCSLNARDGARWLADYKRSHSNCLSTEVAKVMVCVYDSNCAGNYRYCVVEPSSSSSATVLTVHEDFFEWYDGYTDTSKRAAQFTARAINEHIGDLVSLHFVECVKKITKLKELFVVKRFLLDPIKYMNVVFVGEKEKTRRELDALEILRTSSVNEAHRCPVAFKTIKDAFKWAAYRWFMDVFLKQFDIDKNDYWSRGRTFSEPNTRYEKLRSSIGKMVCSLVEQKYVDLFEREVDIMLLLFLEYSHVSDTKEELLTSFLMYERMKESFDQGQMVPRAELGQVKYTEEEEEA